MIQRRKERTVQAWRQVRLREDLCHAAEERLAGGHGGLEGLIGFILTELLRDDAIELDRSESALIEARLRDLGYM